MTTYSGKSHYSTLGKEPFTKKEPLSYIYHKSVSDPCAYSPMTFNRIPFFLQVEKLYQLHRDRVTYVEPKVDDHMYVPDFMNNKHFKLKAKEFEVNRVVEQSLLLSNHLIFIGTTADEA